MSGALAGIKVIEAASYVTGPFASQLLADMGAQVVKIEEPKRGDPFRGWGERNYAATFCSLNRNKQSITLDLRLAEGRDIALALARQADVLIQNFRPGVMDKLGLGYGLFDVVGKPEWSTDPRFSTRKARTENYDALAEQLQPIFRAGERADWLRRLTEKDVPAAPINTLDEVFADPQVKAYGFPVEIEHPKMGKMKLIGNAVDMSRTPPSIETPPPVLGEHTDEILGALGYDPAAISKLRDKGAI